jgi:hypothetical protein
MLGQVQAADDLKTFLNKESGNLERALLKGDMSYFDRMSTPDFTMTEMGRTSDKKTSLKEMEQMNKMFKMTKVKVRLLSLTTKGDTGIAKTSMHAEMDMMPAKKGDKVHKLVSDAIYDETWVRVGNTWKLKKIVAPTPAKMTMDGKPFDPSKLGG